MLRQAHEIEASSQLKHVRYEIRGKLARRAHELERQGYEIIQLNIGNPGLFGFRTPETMRLAMIENLPSAEAYCNQKGIFPAREAVVMQQQTRGIDGVDANHVFMGNGVSELIDLTLRALLNPDDEVLVPSPDYPLWTAATFERWSSRALPVPGIAGLPSGPGRDRKADHAAHARDCGHQPEQSDRRRLYSRTPGGHRADCGTAQPRRDERRDLRPHPVRRRRVRADGDAVPRHAVRNLSGLSKVYRACGYRVGWVSFCGAIDRAEKYMSALDLLASLRLCSNVPGQWAVQTALGGYQSIHELCAPGRSVVSNRGKRSSTA